MAGASKLDDDDGINEINITPMVDIMLVLLVIFMVASVYIVKESIELELPKAASATDAVESTLSIVMDKDRKLYLNGDPISEAGLEQACEKAAAKDKTTQAMIAADHGVYHGDVIRVIDLVRTHGLDKFALNVKRPKRLRSKERRAMMHALEAEPEKEGRWKRMGVGAVIAVALGAGVIIAAKHVVPNSKLLQSVMKIAIVDYVPPKVRPRDEETPKPPEPLQEKPKPKEKAAAAQKAAPQPTNQPPKPETGEPDIGLDADSFGNGSGGAAFHAGTSQMGAVSGGRPFSADAGVEGPKPAAKIVEARARATNRQPAYPEAARKLAVEGLMVIEADIDEQGRVTRANVRKPLEPSLDGEAQRTVLAWNFDPATLAGKPVASTKFVRIRFQLE